MSRSHGVSCCNNTRYLFFYQGWDKKKTLRKWKGPKSIQQSQKQTVLATVRSITRGLNYTNISHMQKAYIISTQTLYFQFSLCESLWAQSVSLSFHVVSLTPMLLQCFFHLFWRILHCLWVSESFSNSYWVKSLYWQFDKAPVCSRISLGMISFTVLFCFCLPCLFEFILGLFAILPLDSDISESTLSLIVWVSRCINHWLHMFTICVTILL